MENVMHLKSLKNLSIPLALVIAFYSTAPQAETKFVISGAGTTSCGKFIKPPKATKEFSDALMATWLQGYLSGTNTQRFIENRTPMKPQPDGESIVAFLEKYCRENPLKTVYDAAIQLDQSY